MFEAWIWSLSWDPKGTWAGAILLLGDCCFLDLGGRGLGGRAIVWLECCVTWGGNYKELNFNTIIYKSKLNFKMLDTNKKGSFIIIQKMYSSSSE